MVRAGYGLFYTPENDAREDVLTKNYPFAIQQQLNSDPYIYPFAYQIDSGVTRTTTVPLAPGQSTIDPSTILPPGSSVNQTVYYVDPRTAAPGIRKCTTSRSERQVTYTMSVDAAYVGSIGRALPYAIGNFNIDGGIPTGF